MTMHFLPLLGKRLRDDEIIEILEGSDLEVVYDFDRLHEGQPDKYWVAAKEGGYEFRFDEAQTLEVVFLYILPQDGYAAISMNCDVSLFATLGEAQRFGEAQHLQITKGRAEFLEIYREWVRLGFATYDIHYEFQGVQLARVTITRRDESPAD